MIEPGSNRVRTGFLTATPLSNRIQNEREVLDSAALHSECRLGGVGLESVICAKGTAATPNSVSPITPKENRTLVALARGLVDSRANVLEISTETILDVTQCALCMHYING
jgi:hypothetical protein